MDTLIIIVGAVLAMLVILLALAGSALVDLALNPRAKRSLAARAVAAAGDGAGSFDDDPLYAHARAWFEDTRQDISLDLGREGVLHGWLLPACGASVGADGASIAAGEGHLYAVLCHGYAGTPADMSAPAYRAHQLGVTVLAPAARGFERNGDRLIGMGWLDAHDLLGWIGLITRADPDARIALYGVSMGGAEVMMASGLDLPRNVRCIVEDCGFTSVWDELALQMRALVHLPVRPLLDAASAACRLRAGYGFRRASALDAVRRTRVPMLFIHGTADTFVPYSMLDRLFNACASPAKERLAIEGAGHARAAVTDPERYYGCIGAFLARHL